MPPWGMRRNFGGLLALLPLAGQLSLRTLVWWPLVGNAVVMAAALAMAAAAPGLGGGAVMAVALPAVGATGLTTACLQAGTFALAALFPPLYTQVLAFKTIS